MYSMKNMLEAGVHYGHKKSSWHPKMKNFIFGINHGIHIIDLSKTLPLFQNAIQFIRSVASSKGKILFVGTKRQAQSAIREEAKHCNMPYVNYRWLGGMLTNYKTVRQSIKKLNELKKMESDGFFLKMTKKESLQSNRIISKLERNLGGVKDMGGIPDALIVIDSNEERIAIEEARRLGIKIVSIVDTNSSPESVDYVVPGNDDSIKSINFYLKAFSTAINEVLKDTEEKTNLEEIATGNS